MSDGHDVQAVHRPAVTPGRSRAERAWPGRSGSRRGGPIEEPGEIRPALERAVRDVLKERNSALVDVFAQFR